MLQDELSNHFADCERNIIVTEHLKYFKEYRRADNSFKLTLALNKGTGGLVWDCFVLVEGYDASLHLH